MYVICFYWQGERWREDGRADGEFSSHLKRTGTASRELVVRYVNNLYKGVRRFASRDFTFICFTNEKMKGLNINIKTRPFHSPTEKGVLPRLYMFSRDAGLFEQQVLCLDLDVVITGQLDDIMEYEGLFCARSKFKPGEEYKLDGDIMSFQASEKTEELFWKPFVENVEESVKMTNGRERYWMRHVADDFADRWDNFAPGQVISYKRHVEKKGKELPDNARIVSCHGFPRPHQIKDKWIKEYWK